MKTKVTSCCLHQFFSWSWMLDAHISLWESQPQPFRSVLCCFLFPWKPPLGGLCCIAMTNKLLWHCLISGEWRRLMDSACCLRPNHPEAKQCVQQHSSCQAWCVNAEWGSPSCQRGTGRKVLCSNMARTWQSLDVPTGKENIPKDQQTPLHHKCISSSWNKTDLICFRPELACWRYHLSQLFAEASIEKSLLFFQDSVDILLCKVFWAQWN